MTALKVINLVTGSVRTLSSVLGNPFSGTLAIAAGGAVVFASPSGVTAYSGSTGGLLWTMRGAVPEGTDPVTGLVYLTSRSGVLLGVDPVAGITATSVPSAVATGSAAVYVVRDGTALGLTGGANGQAWGYDLAAGRVTWTSAALPWPHFFSDLSGLGGSAALRWRRPRHRVPAPGRVPRSLRRPGARGVQLVSGARRVTARRSG